MRPFLQALPALLGVLFGAAATYFSTTAAERSRWQRSQSVRWDERRIAAYTDYAHTVKLLITVVVRIAAHRGVHPDFDDRLDPAEGLPLLAALGEERTVKWEAVLLLGSPEVIRAARTWHQIALELQVLAMGTPDDAAWSAAIEAISQARRGFYEAVRRELRIPVAGSTDVFEWQMPKYLEKATAPGAAASADPD
jgi:hypothetical protein